MNTPKGTQSAGLILFAAPGACSRVAMIALEQSGLDYKVELVRFMKGDHKSPKYLALNPKGKVPCLITEHGPLTENIAIAQYLDALVPGLLPQATTPFGHALISADLAFCSATLHPIVSRIRVPMFFTDGDEAIGAVKNKAIDAMSPLGALIDAKFSDQDWWYESGWSLMDAYLYWIWSRITEAGYPEDSHLNWSAHAERMEQRPAVQRVLVHEQQMQSVLEQEGLALKFE